jgi:hypothetical protein
VVQAVVQQQLDALGERLGHARGVPGVAGAVQGQSGRQRYVGALANERLRYEAFTLEERSSACR